MIHPERRSCLRPSQYTVTGMAGERGRLFPLVPVVVALLVCIAEPPPSDGPGAPGPPLGVHRALDTGRRTPF